MPEQDQGGLQSKRLAKPQPGQEPPRDFGATDPGSESIQTDEVKRLRARVDFLTEQIKDMTTNAAIADTLGYGFRDLVAKLEPLRDMRPRPNGECLPGKTAKALERLETVMKSPNWSNAGSLPINEQPVGWFGQPHDAEGDDPVCADDKGDRERRAAI